MNRENKGILFAVFLLLSVIFAVVKFVHVPPRTCTIADIH